MLSKLERLLLPPASSAYTSPDWVKVESEYSIQLPADYKAFVERYGGGSIDDFLWVIDPFSRSPHMNFDKSEYFRESYALMKVDFPQDYPRPPYPTHGSFWPWAFTENGDTLVWVVDDEPDSWPVALHSADQGEEVVFSCGCIEVLCKLLGREIHSRILPDDFPSSEASLYSFAPFRKLPLPVE